MRLPRTGGTSAAGERRGVSPPRAVAAAVVLRKARRFSDIRGDSAIVRDAATRVREGSGPRPAPLADSGRGVTVSYTDSGIANGVRYVRPRNLLAAASPAMVSDGTTNSTV